MSDIKTIYSNTLGERVMIKLYEGYCIIHVDDEFGDSAEICIPVEYAQHIGECIVDDCKEHIDSFKGKE